MNYQSLNKYFNNQILIYKKLTQQKNILHFFQTRNTILNTIAWSGVIG